MKIKLSKSQWEFMGRKAGWIKVAQEHWNLDENERAELFNVPKKEDIIKEVVQNLPEYSLSLDCTGWKYNELRFSFIDQEDNKKYIIGPSELSKGYDILKQKVEGKQLNFTGLDWNDTGTWDASVVDALVQCAIFGDVIYG